MYICMMVSSHKEYNYECPGTIAARKIFRIDNIIKYIQSIPVILKSTAIVATRLLFLMFINVSLISFSSV